MPNYHHTPLRRLLPSAWHSQTLLRPPDARPPLCGCLTAPRPAFQEVLLLFGAASCSSCLFYFSSAPKNQTPSMLRNNLREQAASLSSSVAGLSSCYGAVSLLEIKGLENRRPITRNFTFVGVKKRKQQNTDPLLSSKPKSLVSCWCTVRRCWNLQINPVSGPWPTILFLIFTFWPLISDGFNIFFLEVAALKEVKLQDCSAQIKMEHCHTIPSVRVTESKYAEVSAVMHESVIKL